MTWKWVMGGEGWRGEWAKDRKCSEVSGPCGEGQARARDPNFPQRDSWQACPFLILHFKDPFKASMGLDRVLL